MAGRSAEYDVPTSLDSTHSRLKLARVFSRCAQLSLVCENDLATSWKFQKLAESLDKGQGLDIALRGFDDPAEALALLQKGAELLRGRVERIKSADTQLPWYRNPWLGAAVGLGGGLLADRLLLSGGLDQQPEDEADLEEDQPMLAPWLRLLAMGLGGAALGYGGMSALNRWGLPLKALPTKGTVDAPAVKVDAPAVKVDAPAVKADAPAAESVLDQPIDPEFEKLKPPPFVKWPVLGLENITDLLRHNYETRKKPWKPSRKKIPSVEELNRLIDGLEAWAHTVAYTPEERKQKQELINVLRQIRGPEMHYVLSLLEELPQGPELDIASWAFQLMEDKASQDWPQLVKRLEASGLLKDGDVADVFRSLMRESHQQSAKALKVLLAYRNQKDFDRLNLPLYSQLQKFYKGLPPTNDVVKSLQNAPRVLPSLATEWEAYHPAVQNWLIPVKLYDLAMKHDKLSKWRAGLFDLLVNPVEEKLQQVDRAIAELEKETGLSSEGWSLWNDYFSNPQKLDELRKRLPADHQSLTGDLLDRYKRMLTHRDQLRKTVAGYRNYLNSVERQLRLQMKQELFDIGRVASRRPVQSLEDLDPRVVPPYFHFEYWLNPSRNPWAELARDEHPAIRQWLNTALRQHLEESERLARPVRAIRRLEGLLPPN